MIVIECLHTWPVIYFLKEKVVKPKGHHNTFELVMVKDLILIAATKIILGTRRKLNLNPLSIFTVNPPYKTPLFLILP